MTSTQLTKLDKIKNILIIIILSAVVINLIINHVKQFNDSPEKSINRLVTEINVADRSVHKIHSELMDLEVNRISEDALEALYLSYGLGKIDEEQFISDLKDGVARAMKVVEESRARCKICQDHVREGMIISNLNIS